MTGLALLGVLVILFVLIERKRPVPCPCRDCAPFREAFEQFNRRKSKPG